MQQWEFLVEGLPLTVERFRVSERLILDSVIGPTALSSPIFNLSHAVAYVAAEGDRAMDAVDARRYLDFFLLLYSYVTGKRVVMEQHVGTPLDKIESLGARKIGLPHYEKIQSGIKEPHPLWDKGIIKTKELFLKLESDREKIMSGHLGLALRFYYLAVSAGERMSRDEFVIHLTIAAEALVQTGEGNLTQNLKRRIATLVANGAEETKEIERNMGELYVLRGLVVHGHKPQIRITQTRQLDSYVRRAVEKGLELRDMTKKDLAQMLDHRYADIIGEKPA